METGSKNTKKIKVVRKREKKEKHRGLDLNFWRLAVLEGARGEADCQRRSKSAQ